MNPRCTCGEARWLTGGEHFRSCPWLYLEGMHPNALSAIEAEATAPWREMVDRLLAHEELVCDENTCETFADALALLAEPATDGKK